MGLKIAHQAAGASWFHETQFTAISGSYRESPQFRSSNKRQNGVF